MWVNSNSEYLPELEKLYTRFDFLREEYSVEKLTTKTEKTLRLCLKYGAKITESL